LGTGFTGFGAVDGGRVVVVVRLGVVVVVVGVVVVVVLADGAVDSVAARGVCAAPAHALSARQAAAIRTVGRMVTEGNPRSRPPAFRR